MGLFCNQLTVQSTGPRVPPPPSTGRLQLLCQCFFQALRGSTQPLIGETCTCRYAYGGKTGKFTKFAEQLFNTSTLHHAQPNSDVRNCSQPFSEECPIGLCITLSGKFPYAPYNYLTNGAGSEQILRCRSYIVRLHCSKTENN